MKGKVRLSDIARQSGVSMSTVSLVLNNKPGASEETQAHVLRVAAELGYPIPAAPKAPSQLTTIGMVVKSDPDIAPQANPFYSKVIIGIEDGCRRQEINLLFSSLRVDADNRPLETPHLLNSEIVDGVVIVGAAVNGGFPPSPNRRTPPIVLVDGYSSSDRYDSVVADNFYAAYQAVEYLIQKGHRRIALAGGEETCFSSLKDRRNGYLRAMKEHGLGEVCLADFNINKTSGYSEITDLLKANPEVTGLFCINDDVGNAAVRAAQDLGIRVPERLSIVGFDDTYVAANAHPGLTTLHVDTVAMGHAAVNLLSLRLENPDSARMTLTIHATLVERASVAEISPVSSQVSDG